MKEEIEKRRAEAAEKKKQLEEESSKPVFAISPKGSSKIGEKAEFLSKSAQKTTPSRLSHSPFVSKIGSRLEQFNSAIQGQKEVKSPKPAVTDIPTGGARSMKNMWEKGNVGGNTESPAPATKEPAGNKAGASGRVNSRLSKPAEPEKTAPPAAEVVASPPPQTTSAKPTDAKPIDSGNKRGMWEPKKTSTPSKLGGGVKRW